MQHIIDSLIDTLERGQSVVLGGIVKSSGSAPRTSGARMLIRQDETIVGTLGGGALEGSCQASAKELLARSDEMYTELSFDLTGESAAEEGMVCGGKLSVLLQKITPDSLSQFTELRDDFKANAHPMLVTRLPQGDDGPKMFSLRKTDGKDFPGQLKEEILRKNRSAKFLVSHGDHDYFIEPLTNPGTVYLIGAGHVAHTTAHLAAFTGFEVVVMDDRAEFANRERFSKAREVKVLDSFEHCISGLGPDDYVVIVTRGHLHDRDVLAQALRTNAGYIGMIGSSKKRKGVYASLMREGFTEQDLARVFSPIGLCIGGDTPEEIGLSIVAEMVKVRSGNTK